MAKTRDFVTHLRSTVLADPHWEHGYRTHGYWIGVIQWGRVGIQARGHGRIPKTGAYRWHFNPRGIVLNNPGPEDAGACDTLRQAKRKVERRYREWAASNDR